MSKATQVLLTISYIVVGISIIIATLVIIKSKKRKNFAKELSNLDREKNLIISAQILAELNKVESLINNDQLREKFNNCL